MSKSLLPIHYQNPQHHYSNNKLHDRVWRTKKFRILSTTLLIFLCSLWAVANFSGAHFDFDTLRPYRNNAAAMAAVSALGEGGEEGIQALEVQTHEFLYGKGHHFGINDMFVDEEDDYDYEWGFWDSGRGKAKDDEDKNLDNVGESGENENDIDKDNENENETSVYKEVQDIIDKHKIVIFSKTYCPYSRRAKHILSQYSISPRPYIMEVDLEDKPNEIKSFLKNISSRSTFPNIFVSGRSIGGSDELVNMHVDGSLKEFLKKAGVIVDGDKHDSA